MNIYLLINAGWESSDIRGVFFSRDRAMAKAQELDDAEDLPGYFRPDTHHGHGKLEWDNYIEGDDSTIKAQGVGYHRFWEVVEREVEH